MILHTCRNCAQRTFVLPAVSCTVSEVEKCEGEAMANNRKGKLIFFYEWNIVLKWVTDGKSGKKIEGKINIPNLSEENEISEVDVSNNNNIINSTI